MLAGATPIRRGAGLLRNPRPPGPQRGFGCRPLAEFEQAFQKRLEERPEGQPAPGRGPPLQLCPCGPPAG